MGIGFGRVPNWARRTKNYSPPKLENQMTARESFLRREYRSGRSQVGLRILFGQK